MEVGLKNGDHTAEIDDGIIVGIAHRFLGDVQNAQRPVADTQTQHGHCGGQQETEGEQRADGVTQTLLVARADMLGDDDLSGRGEAHGDEEEESSDLAAVGGGGQTGGADELTDDDHISHVISLLEQVCKDKGERKGQELLQRIAAGQVPYHGFISQWDNTSLM